jgi:hypothetical protein
MNFNFDSEWVWFCILLICVSALVGFGYLVASYPVQSFLVCVSLMCISVIRFAYCHNKELNEIKRWRESDEKH